MLYLTSTVVSAASVYCSASVSNPNGYKAINAEIENFPREIAKITDIWGMVASSLAELIDYKVIINNGTQPKNLPSNFLKTFVFGAVIHTWILTTSSSYALRWMLLASQFQFSRYNYLNDNPPSASEAADKQGKKKSVSTFELMLDNEYLNKIKTEDKYNSLKELLSGHIFLMIYNDIFNKKTTKE